MTTLALARSRLTSLGFTVAPDAQHPFGTGNCCVFFENRTYLEPITILDRAATDIAAAEGMIFVRRIKRFTERQGEGFAMVALQSDDAEADRAAFEKADLGSEVYRFSRPAKLPDGGEREIGVVLAYAEFSAAPDAAFFACQHLAKDVLFQPEYLAHPNGAAGVARIVAVAGNPADFDTLLASAVGQQGSGASDGPDDTRACLVMTPEQFAERYDCAPPNPRRGMLFAAFEVEVPDIERAARYAGRSAKRREDGIVVPAAPGLGAVVAFRRRLDG